MIQLNMTTSGNWPNTARVYHRVNHDTHTLVTTNMLATHLFLLQHKHITTLIFTLQTARHTEADSSIFSVYTTWIMHLITIPSMGPRPISTALQACFCLSAYPSDARIHGDGMRKVARMLQDPRVVLFPRQPSHH